MVLFPSFTQIRGAEVNMLDAIMNGLMLAPQRPSNGHQTLNTWLGRVVEPPKIPRAMGQKKLEDHPGLQADAQAAYSHLLKRKQHELL